ncbi:MAG: hypothetical protein K0V04_26885, partial [Deltaproteobacteria bacterium]|nr:hypothetical protein [Deltaproteobacteria bacterium]
MLRGNRHVASLDGLIDSGPDSAPGRLRTRVGLALFIAMVGLWLAPIGPVLAAALPVPAGWEQGPNAAPDARRRAEAWAAAWGGSVRHVITPSGRDDFAETLVVVDVSRPMPADAFGDPAVATAWLQRQAATALGATASVDETSVEQIPWTTPGVTVLVGRVIVESRAARIAFAPRGPSHVVVMLLVTASEEVLYADLFDETVDALEGLRPPVVAFSTGRWRGVAIVLWLLVAGIATVLWTRRNLPQPGARAAGRQVAAVLGIAALAVFVLVGLALDTASVELSLAGSSPWGMAAELGAVGLAAAGLAIVGTELWERRLQPIVSAPRAGSFASGGSPSPRRATALRAAMPGEPPPPAVDPWQGATIGGLATSHPPPDSGGTAVGPAPTNVPVPLPSDVNTAPIPVPSHHDASGGTPRPSQVPTDRLAPVPHDIGRAPRSLPSDIPTDRLASMPHVIGRAPGSLPTDRLAPMPHDIGRAPGSLPSDIPTDRLAPMPHDIGRASGSLPSDIPTDRLAPVPRDIGRASDSLPSDIPT